MNSHSNFSNTDTTKKQMHSPSDLTVYYPATQMDIGSDGRQEFHLPETRDGLIKLWTKTIGKPPPKHMSKQFMQKAILFEYQFQTYGSHSKQVRRIFKRPSKENLNFGTNSRNLCKRQTPTLVLKTGTHLVREWNGRTYQVKVLDDGFEMDGNHYSSLTMIAKKITGTHWSGPRFFGLNK